jgi:hypothetical protein
MTSSSRFETSCTRFNDLVVEVCDLNKMTKKAEKGVFLTVFGVLDWERRIIYHEAYLRYGHE